MIHRLTNRNSIKNGEWLQQLVEKEWSIVQPIPPETVKLQQCDFVANLSDGLVIQRIKDAFQNVTESVDNPPNEGQRVGSDGYMAVAIHKALTGLTPREASDPDFWAYLACVGCPSYVRWRWNTNKASALWTRLAGNIRRNALSRLWWWAEITHDSSKHLDSPERYSITKDVQGRQSLMLWFVDCVFSGHVQIVSELSAMQKGHSLNDAQQKKLCRSVNRLARVVCLDSLPAASEAKLLCEQALHISQLLAA